MSVWVAVVDTFLAYLGATAVLLSSETQILPRRRVRRPRLLRAWSRFVAILAVFALGALVFAVMFSDAQPNLLVPMGITFSGLAFAFCTWLWFRMARRNRAALCAFVAMYAVAALIFAATWAAVAMPAIGFALATPCALTIAALVFVTVRGRDTAERPHERP